MDIFQTLTGGARFNKEKFKDDLALFQKGEQCGAHNTGVAGGAGNYCDFFGSSGKQNAKKDRAVAAAVPGDGGDACTHPDAEEASVEEGSANALAVAQDPVRALEEIRRAYRIRVESCVAVAAPLASFKELYARFSVPAYLQENVSAAGFAEPSAIQRQAVPVLLAGQDLLACAPTGSGKTLAYLLPAICGLGRPAKDAGVRACVVAPTRELAIQIEREVKKLVSKKWKVVVLSKSTALPEQANIDFLIATPMRLVQAIQQGAVHLHRLKHLIFDEADKLLELGFLEQADEILVACSETRQTAMFSATLSSSIEALAKSVMKSDVVRIIVGQKNTAASTVEQSLVFAGDEAGKLLTIRQAMRMGALKPPVLVFVQSIYRAKELFRELVYDGINVDMIHADRTKQQRDNIIAQFRSGRIWVLIATDVLARGVDLIVNTVVNYDFPTSTEVYIHRIGRAGRAGRHGKAVTYFTRDDATYLRNIVNIMKESGCDVPEWMLKLKKADQNQRKNLRQSAPKRDTISTTSKYDAKRLKRKREMVEGSKRRKAKCAAQFKLAGKPEIELADA